MVRVRALKEVLDGGHVLSPMGLTDLVELTAEVIPEGLHRALAAAQKASVGQKRRVAHRIVGVSATAVAAAGATPIPFSDAVLLVPIQISMLASISSAFGLDHSAAFLSVLVAAATGSTGTTFAGRAIVGGLLKLIPGVGTLLGGAVSGATAAALTTTLGELYTATLVAVFRGSQGETPDGAEQHLERRLDVALQGLPNRQRAEGRVLWKAIWKACPECPGRLGQGCLGLRQGDAVSQSSRHRKIVALIA